MEQVAVKSLKNREDSTKDGEAKFFEKEKATFLSETEVMKRLNHPNLVKMLGVCIEKSPFYLVQELCNKGDLKNHLKHFELLKSLPHLSKKERYVLAEN